MRTVGSGTLAVAALAVCGCVDGDVAPVAPDARFDLDVVVHMSRVDVWVRDHIRPLCVPEHHFPRPGECAEITDDFTCASTGDACPARVALERHGTILAEQSGLRPLSPTSLPADLEGTSSQLVIQRCAESIRIALPSPERLQPVLTEISTDGESLSGTMSTPEGTTGTYAMAANDNGGEGCQVAGIDTWTVPLAPGRDGYWPATDLLVASIRRFESSPTPWGTANVWTMAYASRRTELTSMAKVADDRWRIRTRTEPAWSVWVDGEPFEDERWFGLSWEFRTTPDGLLHQLASGDYFVYEAGATEDRLRVLLTNGWHRATIPHVAPSNELVFSLADDGRFELAVGPVALTSETEPSLTRQLAFTVSWDHAVVPRPVP